MVSFFGLKFGDKKKRPDGKVAQDKELPQRKRIDQNALGDGQFFGQSIHQKGVLNGSLRPVSRAATDGIRSPYANHDTQNLAASSMFDLNNIRPGSRGSRHSLRLRLNASELNLRARFGANNASSTSLAAPGPGFSSRPATANGKASPWVNPLDVHFMRGEPPRLPTPKSPLAQPPLQLPPTPTSGNAETGSVFGEEADELVDAVISSIKKQEAEENEAREREKELEKRRETARLEMERLERQKSTESTLTTRPSSAPRPEPAPPMQPPSGAVFVGDLDGRPASRDGPIIPLRPPLHQGPPPTGPPTQRLPQLPSQGPSRQGAEATRVFASGGGPPPKAPAPQTPRPCGAPTSRQPHNAGIQGLPNSRSSQPSRPPRPPPLHGFSPLGGGSNGPQSPKPASIGDHSSKGPAPQSPALDRAPGSGQEPQTPVEPAWRTTGETQGEEPLESALASQSSVTSPSGSISQRSLDDEPLGMFSRPIIRDVAARRDTQTFGSARQQSLSMRIEELEKTLINEQELYKAQKAQLHNAETRVSTGSSLYSEAAREDDDDDDDDDDDGPILSIQPAPLRIQPPQPPVIPSAASANRPQSPFRGPPRRGTGPRRPALEEYGISSNQVAVRARGPTTSAPSSRSGSTDNYSSHSSPPSRANTPQLRAQAWRRDAVQPISVQSGSPERPTTTPNTVPERPQPGPVIDSGFKFDFGSGVGVAAPPTPDSTSWPLSPSSEKGSTSAQTTASEPQPSKPNTTQEGGITAGAGKFTRANVPPPLNFNFSPDAPSRDPTLHSGSIHNITTTEATSLWTPPLRSAPLAASGFPPAAAAADGRPSSLAGAGSGGGSGRLAESPRLISQFPDGVPRDDYDDDDKRASFMGIGVARGPSIREVRRPPRTVTGHGHGRGGQVRMVDSFGTGFI